MIQIKENSLIIELPCENEQPLALLADLQSGLIDIISIIAYTNNDVPPDHLRNGVFNLHKLLKEMLIGQDQGHLINKSLTKAQTNDFNKWGSKPGDRV